MKDKIYECMLTALENNSQAIFFYDKKQRNPFLASKRALEFYANKEGIIDVYDIFEHKEAGIFLKSAVMEKLEKDGFAMLYDVETRSNEGKFLICDVQVAYADQNKETLYIEMHLKTDTRMEMALNQINLSPRAEGLFQLDETLSFIHCNESFQQVFELEKDKLVHAKETKLTDGFLPEKQEKLLQEIQEALEKSPTYFTQVQVLNKSGKTHWYTLELQRRALDDSGTDKLMVYMFSIDDQIQTEEKLDDISQYFNIMQRLCNGLLYRFDTENRILYRDEETANSYHIATKTENFPNPEWLSLMVHPDDWEEALLFINKLIQGEEGTKTLRLKTPSGSFEYHKFTFKAVRNTDGSVKEMLGFAENVHNFKEVEDELVNINQYLNVIQKETLCTIMRYDIKKRILHRDADLAKEHGLAPFIENYPNEEQVTRAVHPDYRDGYYKFFDQVVSGQEGTYRARLITVENTFEHHTITARAVRNPDSSIHEMLITVLNVNDLTETENELSDVTRHFDALQKLSDELLFRIDLKTKMLTRHGQKVKLFGLTEESVLFPDALYESGSIYSEDLWTFEEFAQDIIRGEAGTVELRMRERENENFAYRRIVWSPISNEKGEITDVIGKILNVQAVKDLEEQANYDSLTRALNKRAISEATTQVLNRSKEGEKHALLFLDLDNFKYVNDNLGHIFGDFLLKKLGSRIRECIRYHDLVGRVGGDEFVVVLRDVQSTEMLMGKAKLLLSAISEDIVDNNKRHSIQASIGVAMYPDHGNTYEELYHHADLALYQSKENGKNLVSVYNPEKNND